MTSKDAGSKTSRPGHRPRRPSLAESRVDALLSVGAKPHVSGRAEDDQAGAVAPLSALERLRQLFECELCGAFEELREKYAARGISLTLDPSPFLRGGVDIAITIGYRGAGLRLDGTVTPNQIAFRQTRFDTGNSSGLTGSGPTLRTRDLSAQTFRDFVCGRMGALLQSVVGKT